MQPQPLLPGVGACVRVANVHRGGIASRACMTGDLIGGVSGADTERRAFAETVNDVAKLTRLVGEARCPSDLALVLVRHGAVLCQTLHKPRPNCELGLSLVDDTHLDWQEVHEQWLDESPPPRPAPPRPAPPRPAPPRPIPSTADPSRGPPNAHASIGGDEAGIPSTSNAAKGSIASSGDVKTLQEQPKVQPPPGAPAGGRWVRQRRFICACIGYGTRAVYLKGNRSWDASGQQLTGPPPRAAGNAGALTASADDGLVTFDPTLVVGGAKAYHKWAAHERERAKPIPLAKALAGAGLPKDLVVEV